VADANIIVNRAGTSINNAQTDPDAFADTITKEQSIERPFDKRGEESKHRQD
jgi:hypothetical protein